MNKIVTKTLGGLSREYYVRQFIFGLLFAGFVYMMITQGGEKEIKLSLVISIIANTLLYPYSRFVYESIVGFIMGNNIIFANIVFILIVKIIFISLCWSLALFIAPFGLMYLYYYHSKNES